uniref:Uncharacterized protein n=1 Tax=Anguilla anguilla TaxID=7936 RepID=A0A0E9T3G8_ANGAN
MNDNRERVFVFDVACLPIHITTEAY